MPQIVIVAAVFSFVLVIVLMLFLFINTRRRSSTSAGTITPATQAMVADARYDPGERPASLVSEQIEEVVKGKLKQYPDLTNVNIDFGSVTDLSMDIWIDDKQYDNVTDIPDERIRQAIEQAVSEMNS